MVFKVFSVMGPGAEPPPDHPSAGEPFGTGLSHILESIRCDCCSGTKSGEGGRGWLGKLEFVIMWGSSLFAFVNGDSAAAPARYMSYRVF